MDILDTLLGLHREPKDLTALHMSLRAIIAMLVALVYLRVGMRRSLSRASAFDFLTGIVLGSVLSRAINGSASFVGTLVASGVIIALHAGLAEIAARSHRAGLLLKGRCVQVLRAGQPDVLALRRVGFSEDDLQESMRMHGNVSDYSELEAAYLERNGQISVVKRKTG